METLLSEPVQAIVAINVLLVLSLLFPFVTGVWSMGLPGFMAVGAYAGGWLTQAAGWPVWAALVASAVAGAAITLPFGLLSLRIRGIYLAIATLAAAELIQLFFSHFAPTGGVMGLTGMPFLDPRWIVALAALAFAASAWLYCTRLGKAMQAAGSDPVVAACHGLNVPALQMSALAIGGALAGLAGACFAHYYSFVAPNNFGFSRTVDILMFLVIGGFTPVGAVLGSTVLTLLPQFVSELERWAPALYGTIALVMAAFMPAGLVPKNRFGGLARRLRRRDAPTAVPAAAGARTVPTPRPRGGADA
ncbi:MAG TPA: branched-chain amino acid ABC transporter permease [Burkholderiaceae bacterium]|nr:branched-chain amino acid ABC transporter permease [Burkholderiaceae bacterium]